MTNFWNNLPKPFYILAPMEAVTGVVFRHVVAKAGRPDVFFTEFTNAASYCSPKGKDSTRGRLTFTDDEQPMVAQIWGNNPDQFREMAFDLKEMGYSGIDINMGCPVANVAGKGAGSGLIREPELAAQLIAATKEAGLPVSVKTRLGYTSTAQWMEWLGHILRQDIVNLTIHLRTRKEMSKVPAHHELIADIKKLRDEIAPQTLLTINGDIRDRAHGEELVKQYGVDGIMIGRGVFTNPFAFAKTHQSLLESSSNDPKATAALENTSLIRDFPGVKGGSLEDDTKKGDLEINAQKAELIALLNYHLDLHDKYALELGPRKFDPLKRFFKIYIRDFAGASELRDKLMHTKTTDEVRALIN